MIDWTNPTPDTFSAAVAFRRSAFAHLAAGRGASGAQAAKWLEAWKDRALAGGVR